jgi:oxalate---CoA ligase
MPPVSDECLLDVLQAGKATAAALIRAEDGRQTTHSELDSAVTRLAGRLSALGVVRGSRVAMVIVDGSDFIQLLLALVTLGATAAPLNPGYTRDEYAFYLDDLQPDLLLVSAGDLHAVRDAGRNVRLVDVSSSVDGPPTLAGASQSARFAGAAPEDTALLLHTSGTTSRPKQVPLLQRNLAASSRSIAGFYGLGPEDVSFVAMPLFHVHGLVASTFAALAAGGAVVVPRRFSARAFWPQARQHRVTWFSAAPTLHQMILDRIDSEGAPPTLRFARSCSSALSPVLMERLEQTLGVPLVEAYGMTEASHQMASNPLPPAKRVPGSVGIASGVEIRVVDDRGQDVPSGEIAIRGPGVTPGYLSNPQANAESFFDGWFRTGDRGSLDGGGYLRLAGRIKEMILRGGENISPYEIEDVLRTHPAVADVVCFGIPDEKYGERVGAAVQPLGDIDERALTAWCRERLAAFKVPEAIYLLDAIPRTPTGKLQRKRIAETLAQ